MEPPTPSRPEMPGSVQDAPQPDDSSSTSSRKRPLAAVPDANGEANGKSTPDQAKRRRRKLSCETCQRRKCRCDYDPVSRTCHRCRTLRIPCSFTDDASLPAVTETVLADGKATLEERLQSFEDSIRDVKATLEDVRAGLQDGSILKTKARRNRHDPSDSSQSDVGPEDISDPADAGINSAPALVIREVTRQLIGGSRRLFEHINPDAIQLGFLDEQTADELIRLFCRHRGDGLVVLDVNSPNLSRELRNVSPFLHSVCCINGIPYSTSDLDPVRCKQLYEQVRITMGQALLASPLPLEEINAVLLMSSYSNTSPALGSQVDYIDSWLLTGYCAQQAMLSISFSGIVDNVRQGRSTSADRRAIRLWANICRHHLHWAATTGRPSTIPTSYLNQCNMLLNVFQATVQEGIVLADTLLYVALNRKLAHHSYLGADGECEEFALWKQRWAHLFAQPRSSAFKLSYHAAYFILAVRRLEAFIGGEELLSPAADDEVAPSNNTRSETSRAHEAHALRFAVEILETFLEMSVPARSEIPIYLHMCVSYSALIIGQYWREETATEIPPAATVVELLSALEEWSSVSTSASVAPAYVAGLAKKRVQTRARSARREFVAGLQHGAAQLGPDGSLSSPLYNAAEGLLGLGGGSGSVSGGGPRSASMSLVADMPDIGLTPPFPSMEDFFAGGFLDFIR
ncbi:Transcriptional activator of proteases prtT [Pleurostoma richardsiae]|uniref:Transcriptional activator of proteases prtT n=1 Tax=Pleurostoma richardsiae TaxID=41990 RepID=A0AA38R6K8_9PEZI|nr:Transcriptional activator of proteases prtT [Pleurostoma richardsiae]